MYRLLHSSPRLRWGEGCKGHTMSLRRRSRGHVFGARWGHALGRWGLGPLPVMPGLEPMGAELARLGVWPAAAVMVRLERAIVLPTLGLTGAVMAMVRSSRTMTVLVAWGRFPSCRGSNRWALNWRGWGLAGRRRHGSARAGHRSSHTRSYRCGYGDGSVKPNHDGFGGLGPLPVMPGLEPMGAELARLGVWPAAAVMVRLDRTIVLTTLGLTGVGMAMVRSSRTMTVLVAFWGGVGDGRDHRLGNHGAAAGGHRVANSVRCLVRPARGQVPSCQAPCPGRCSADVPGPPRSGFPDPGQQDPRTMFIETEGTPNPATLKFIPGREVMGLSTADFASGASAARSPLATALFELDGVARVFWAATSLP